MSSKFSSVVKLLRLRQWVKNIFVIAPLIFSRLFVHPDALFQGVLAMGLFCVASSAVYIVNDLLDREQDRLHPVKSRSRPIASGEISVLEAVGLLMILYGILFLGWFFQPAAVVVMFFYVVLNLAYSLWLKHQPVLDIFTIAFGFVLRVYAGAQVLLVPVSSWMFVTTLCLALYLAAVKRRQELSQTASDAREVLKHYTVELTDRYAEMAATGALLFYSIFVIFTHPELVVSVPFVLFGMFRYWYMVESLGEGESPTDALLSDKQLLITIILWMGSCLWVLWPTA